MPLTTSGFLPGTPELLARAFNLCPDRAVLDMIVDQSHRLHEGVHRGRPYEFPALPFELLRQRDRLRRGRCGPRLRQLTPVRLVPPDEGGQRAFPFDELLRPPRIMNNRLDLAAMADDAFVSEQTVDVELRIACDPIEVKFMECRTEVLAFRKDSAPA